MTEEQYKEKIQNQEMHMMKSFLLVLACIIIGVDAKFWGIWVFNLLIWTFLYLIPEIKEYNRLKKKHQTIDNQTPQP
jgi:hypothetical protein